MALLRIDFLNDRGGGASTGDGKFDLTGPDTLLPPIDRAPHNKRFYDMHARALERYFDVQSYGRVVLEVDVWPAEPDSAYHLNDMADLGPWAFGQGATPPDPRRASTRSRASSTGSSIVRALDRSSAIAESGSRTRSPAPPDVSRSKRSTTPTIAVS